ncbi:MAG: divalent-cation tolerance protein CutA [Pyrinomonadaceae bacterium]|nr:divalent-cation tolerance protein CutA [Pyrinomonadaceae bacterium]
MKSDVIVVLTTVANSEEAERLARKIVEAKLAACVQILPPMRSVYVWENAVQSASENLLLIKTFDGKFDELDKFIREHHSYEIPEIVALAAENISASYLGWLQNSLA